MAVELFLCLLAHAVLRHLNSTGDMYAHLPDIADWLQQDESRISMTVLLISGKHKTDGQLFIQFH